MGGILKSIYTVIGSSTTKNAFVYSKIFTHNTQQSCLQSYPSFDFTTNHCKNPLHLNYLFLFLHNSCLYGYVSR